MCFRKGSIIQNKKTGLVGIVTNTYRPEGDVRYVILEANGTKCHDKSDNFKYIDKPESIQYFMNILKEK